MSRGIHRTLMANGLPFEERVEERGTEMRASLQLALYDAAYAQRLEQAIAQDSAFRGWHVRRVPRPDPDHNGVIVLDEEALAALPQPLPHPERMVMVTERDSERLSRAWEAGIASVVGDKDPVSTVMMAILAARFRAPWG